MNVPTDRPLVGILMGSASDWTNKMDQCAAALDSLGVPYEVNVISAHRASNRLVQYIESAEARGVELLIAAAGGAAHLPGVAAGHSKLPVLGVPMVAWSLDGMDSLLSIAQMPAGVPVATFAIGKAGAKNSAYFAASMLGLKYPALGEAYRAFRKEQSEARYSVDAPGALPTPDFD